MNLKVEDLERELRMKPSTKDEHRQQQSHDMNENSMDSLSQMSLLDSQRNPSSFVLASIKEALL